MKLHICKENPCPVKDKECSDILNNGFTVKYAKNEKIKVQKELNYICNECARQLYPPKIFKSQELNGITMSEGVCDICKIKSFNIPIRDLWRCIDAGSRMWD